MAKFVNVDAVSTNVADRLASIEFQLEDARRLIGVEYAKSVFSHSNLPYSESTRLNDMDEELAKLVVEIKGLRNEIMKYVL